MQSVRRQEMEELESNTKPAAIDDADDDNVPELMEVDVDGSETFSFVEALKKPKQDITLHDYFAKK